MKSISFKITTVVEYLYGGMLHQQCNFLQNDAFYTVFALSLVSFTSVRIDCFMFYTLIGHEI